MKHRSFMDLTAIRAANGARVTNPLALWFA